MSTTPFVVGLIETNKGVDVIQAKSLKDYCSKTDCKLHLFLDGYIENKYTNPGQTFHIC